MHPHLVHWTQAPPPPLALRLCLLRRAGRGGRGALILAGAAQLITISALNGSYPPAVTWSSLLLAIAPAPLAAVAAFAPARIVRLAAAVVGVVVLVAGMAGGIGLIGVFFIPAAVVLAVAAVKLWRERP
jgi:hypothetical protein